MRRTLTAAACAALVGLAGSGASRAQDEVIDRTPVDCIQVSRIRSTRVTDDRTILFYMRPRSLVYRNDLPNLCPRLEREERFAYQARTGRLCRLDTITVLESFGVGIQPGATCGLGEFTPITRGEADDIVAGPRGAKRAADAIGVEEVELPDEEDETPAGGADADDDGEGAAPSGGDGSGQTE